MLSSRQSYKSSVISQILQNFVKFCGNIEIFPQKKQIPQLGSKYHRKRKNVGPNHKHYHRCTVDSQTDGWKIERHRQRWRERDREKDIDHGSYYSAAFTFPDFSLIFL